MRKDKLADALSRACNRFRKEHPLVRSRETVAIHDIAGVKDRRTNSVKHGHDLVDIHSLKMPTRKAVYSINGNLLENRNSPTWEVSNPILRFCGQMGQKFVEDENWRANTLWRCLILRRRDNRSIMGSRTVKYAPSMFRTLLRISCTPCQCHCASSLAAVTIAGDLERLGSHHPNPF